MNIKINSQNPKGKGKAKQVRIEINKKRVDFPKKASHISNNDSKEVSLVNNEFETSKFNEFYVEIKPKTLHQISYDDSKHQSMKDKIRKNIVDIKNNGINIAYPYLFDRKTPYEKDFKSFSQWSKIEKPIIKIFDLLDIEGLDIIILPIPNTSNFEEWMKVALDVFTTRQADFLNDYYISGYIPRIVTDTTARKMMSKYYEKGICSYTFDFDRRKVTESRMKNISEDFGKNWNKIHIHGTNVPHFDWYGTHNKPILSTYDLLISIYGFDSFSNVRFSSGGDEKPIDKIKLKKKMENKRYRLIDTYGTYNYNALDKLIENYNISCKCPICRKKSKKPIDIYNKEITQNGLKTLERELKEHRLFNTHKEINQVANLINKNKYVEHLAEKKVVTNELNEILNELNRSRINGKK